jgi:malate dehydrogenase (oxaloacetate-decarboxylating)
LEQRLDIPVFHDDQHGTAIVVGAALLNASRLLHKPLASLKVVVSGTGAAGSNILHILHRLGVRDLYAINIQGVVRQDVRNQSDFVIQELLDEGIISEPDAHITDMKSLITNADVFIGVSAPNILTREMVASMRKDPIIFALANPIPEIMPDEALLAGAKIIGTGRSDFPNQINNVLVFPGLMKGLIASRARNVTMEMKLAALYALADLIKDELRTDYILPDIFDPRLAPTISEAIIRETQKEKPSD